MHFVIFGERLCDVVKKRKHPCLLRRWSMFSSHTAYHFVALYVLPGMHFIAAYLLYLLRHEKICFGRRNYMYKRCKVKVLALNSLIPYLGKIIFRASDWTAAPAKKPELRC